jgi:hypothetical protein
MLDEKAIPLNENLLTYRVYEFTALLVFILPVFVITLFKLDQIFLYAHILFGHAAALAVALIRLSRSKLGKHIDVELALVLTVTDLVTRFYLPPMVYTINNICIFSAVLLFLYRQTRLPIRKNGLFLLGYSISYFGLNYKLIDFGKEGLLGLVFSIVLSAYFAFTLLCAGKVKNLYRATFCAGMALLSVIVLAKRVYVDLYNPVVLIQAADTCLLAYCFIHWNSGKEDASAVFGKVFFDVRILPNTILFVSVICYSFFSDIIAPTYAIFGLVIVVFVWYMIFAVKGFMPLFNKKKEERPLTLMHEIALCFSNGSLFKNYLKSITI